MNKWNRCVLAGFSYAIDMIPGTDYTRCNRFPVSPDYSAPEAILGSWTWGSDIYSACTILYACLTGSAPVPVQCTITGDWLGAEFSENFWLQKFDDGKGNASRKVAMIQDMLLEGFASDPAARPTASALIETVNDILMADDGKADYADDVDHHDYDMVGRDEAPPMTWIGYPDAERERRIFYPSLKDRVVAKVDKVAHRGFKSIKAVFRPRA